MKKVLLVVGHQKSAQGAINKELHLTEWEWNSRFVKAIADILKDAATAIVVDVPHWQKAPMINDMHAKTPFAAVIEFHLNSCESDKRVNYCLAKYARGSNQGQDLSAGIIAALSRYGVVPANWADTSPKGVFPTDRPPPKTEQHGQWWEKNGWRYRGATFLWKTRPPAVLLEPFFISCTEFTKKHNDQENLNKLAEVVAGAITEFLSKDSDI